jgi:hypothetical protein
MIQKWYRGHSGQRSALDNFGVIWLTDDPEYAQVYAETEDDIISVVYVEENKLKPADWWDDLDFEPYFPDDENIAEFKKEGCNGYYFMASYGYDEYQCLALFSKEPIVKVEEYKENNINEIMKLTNKDLSYIISEATKRIVMNEISWGVAHDANEKSENRVDMLSDAMYDFEEACDKMQQALKGEAYEYWYKDDEQPENTQGPILAQKIENLFSEVQSYVQRKKKQLVSLKGHEKDKFNSAFGGRSHDEVADDIDKVWDSHFEEDDYTPWNEYKKSHLTPDEQDFNDRNP